MNIFNVGAWRPTNGKLRTGRLSAASDLVARTLSAHGLQPPARPQTQSPQQTMSSLLAAITQARDPSAAPVGPLPSGAAFRSGQFSCKVGSRNYRAYVPSNAAQGVTGVVVMLHGCTQTPEDFAIGTGMNALADKLGFVVVYPHQSRGDNAQSCWNWFSRGDQRRDRGEPAILAGLTRDIMTEYEIPPQRTFVAGLSAGAAMAVILGQTYPDIFSAIGAHSGLPFGAANDVPSAFAAMGGNALNTPAPTPQNNAVRAIVFHGSADSVVHPSNGDRILQDALHCTTGQTIETKEESTASNRRFTRSIASHPDGATAVEHWRIEGLGHAWSGGDPKGTYTDASGPDASAEMILFFFEPDTKDL
ncbi:extracellular catalytic domain type 1 short-chain-length polyhydroxyalkanoate depolymerase [Sulfitobacter sp.]|uniref:extracellular catalytic domain type 1 short-chain-length polyhydroxyalkanoate depolymerase n=1 Tax=Sulfitobacter sp. TaxID=1903071 RepID=UPI003001C9C5